MNTKQINKAEKILSMYFYVVNANKIIDQISRQGSSQEARFFEYEGDFPQLSSIKPDITSSKASKIRFINIDDMDRIAYRIVMDLPLKARQYLTAWYLAKGRYNKATQRRFTMNDVALALKVDSDHYARTRLLALEYILVIFENRTKGTKNFRAPSHRAEMM